MTKCTCGHNKKEHIRTVSEGTSVKFAVGLGCAKCGCDKYTQKNYTRCNEYFRPEPNPERLDGRCAKPKGHGGQHDAILMYRM